MWDRSVIARDGPATRPRTGRWSSPGTGSGLPIDSTTVIERTRIAELAALPDGPVAVGGWVETVRDQKKVQFVVLRDETGAVQLVNPAVREAADGDDDAALRLGITETISALAHGSFVHVVGTLKHDERVKLGGIEVRVESLEVVSAALPETPIADDSSLDKRLDWRFLDLRHRKQNLIFRIQTTLEHAFRSYWIDRDYIEIHTPKLMASPSESRAELFQLEYFETTAYLAQSPQNFKQMAQPAGFGAVFEIADAFRADPSFTSRHATEFTSVDAEFSWITSHEDVMRMHEEVLVAGFTAVKDKYGDEIRDVFGFEIAVPETPFPRVTLADARRIVAENGYEIPRADGDLDPEGERRIAAWAKETHGSEFVFVTDYDATIRPYYHMRHADDPTLTNSYDLIFNGAEIATGAQREHRVEVLTQQAVEKGLDPAELEWYLDFFRYGVPPHGGFGMGLARVLMLMLHEPSIREVTYLFRGPTRLTP